MTVFAIIALFVSGCTQTTSVDSQQKKQESNENQQSANEKQPSSNEHQQLLDQTMKLAEKGYAINTEKEDIKLGTLGPEVLKKFGKPDDGEEESVFLTYSKKHLEIYLLEDEGTPKEKKPVVTISTTDQRYEKITYQQVIETVKGYKKVSESKGEDGVYVTYQG